MNKPVLQGKTITLRPLRAQDADVIFAYTDPEVNRLTGTTENHTLEQYRTHYASLENAQDRADYAIITKPSDELAGEVVVNDIDWHSRVANFRIVLFDSRFFGKGYGSEATALILEYAFKTLNLHRLELEVFEFNPRALHVYENLGFVREGVKRDVLLWEGEYYNAVVMSLLGTEYQPRTA